MKQPRVYKYRKVRTNNGLNFTDAFKTWFWHDRGNRCEYCGDPIETSKVMHIDHVVPRILGGSDDFENLRASCAFCNLAKGARDLDYLRQILRLKRSDLHGIITVKQLLQLEEKGISLPVAKTLSFHFEMSA